MSFPDPDLCSIDQKIACLHLPALPWDAAAWNMDGGQEAIFYCRCSLTSPHFAHVLCCLWLVKSIQLRNQQEVFFLLCLFICLFVFLNWVPQIVAHKGEQCQKLTEKRRKTWLSIHHLLWRWAESDNVCVWWPLCQTDLASCVFIYVKLT